MMEKEKARKNRLKIYCIFFENKDQSYNVGNIRGKAVEVLNTIVKIGETNMVYKSDSLETLCQAFTKINEAIETNYRLKLNKQ